MGATLKLLALNSENCGEEWSGNETSTLEIQYAIKLGLTL